MVNRLAEIQEAIDRFQMDRARELIGEELEENPSADAYFLAAQAALSHGQRIEYLRSALELDPEYQPASDELAQIIPAPPKELSVAAPAPAPPPVTAPPPVPAPPPVTQRARLATVSRRWLAIIVDGLAVGVITLMLAGVGGVFMTLEAALLSDDANVFSSAASQFQNDVLTMNFLVSAVYNIAFMTMFNGQTLGKIMLKLRVIKKNGRRIGILDAIIRNVFGYTISGMFLLGYLWAIFDREKQTWHDKLAGTVVVDERAVEKEAVE
ncbi:MAG: RDD family protein [Chloroflexi bacterium]|nr:RDD family protein [Chloroflexota bacterium]